MRSHYCGQVNASHIDQEVSLCGWVHRRRDHGGLIFVDLRDREGLVQVVFHPEEAGSFKIAETLRNEFVVRVEGKVRRRPEGTVNPDLPTGEIEIAGMDLQVLNESQPVPFRIDDYQEVGEETRLRYRYLDLRRPEMNARLRLRAKMNHFLRNFLEAEGFTEVETPYLTKTTPEGARDYLVPSRVNPGLFYALAQSPQIFKQLLMVSGLDRYYQIVRCFRDEDLRADRQPEFTQLDLEMSFVDQKAVMALMETLIRDLFRHAIDVELPEPFPVIHYQDAMQRFGTDRPDLRIPLELVEVSDLFKDVDFKVFAKPANDELSRVAALRLPHGVDLSRKEIDDYTTFVGKYGAKGLAFIKVNDLEAGMEGLQSPILKFLPEEVINDVLRRVEAKTGDIIFFGADRAHIVNEALGALRVKMGKERKLFTSDWQPVWVVDFPMFGHGDDGHYQALHHPFTAPYVEEPEHLLEAPMKSHSRAYDIVLNGYEIGGGSVRIHRADMQYAVLKLLGMDKDEADEKFGHLISGLQMGCPPHAGIAFGLDRIAMLMSNASSIRSVIAFPKTQTAHCPLTRAPAPVDAMQLQELGLRIAPGAQKGE